MNKPPQKPRFELRHTQGVPVASEDLLADLRRVSVEIARPTVTYREYQSAGQYHPNTMMLRFGSWNEALKQAGFEISNELTIDADRLFENMERLWIALGLQPTKRDLGTTRSEFSEGPYTRTFGSWRKALQAFVEWANADDASTHQPATAGAPDNPEASTPAAPRTTKVRSCEATI